MELTPAYARLQGLLTEERCVILDGGIATEVSRRVPPPEGDRDEPLWGTSALMQAPDAVLDVHRSYVDAGCDVISTNTWGIASALELDAQPGRTGLPLHWMDVARRGVRVGRQAIADGGRTSEVALAFSISGDVENERKLQTLALLTRVLSDDPPDLILLETMTSSATR